MRWRDALSVMTLLALAALLIACSGSTATSTPTATPTVAATRPVGSAGSGATATIPIPPTVAAAIASAAAATRPATSVTTGSASAVAGTRPVGSAANGSVRAGTAGAGSATAGTAFAVFTDPKGRFAFSRPAAWMVGQSSATGSIVQFTAMNPHGVIDISTEPVPAGITPGTYRDAALAEIKKGIPDAQEIGTTTLQLDTEPAVQIDYTGTVGGSTIAFSQIFALHTGTGYILTLGTAPADIDTMKQQAIVVLQTWKFLP